MERNFECWGCKKRFSADDRKWVECPYCHSDNVEYATWHLPNHTKAAVAGCIIIGAACAVGYYLYSSSNHKEAKIEKKLEDPMVIGTDTITTTDYDGEQAPMLSMTTDMPEFDGETYSFEMQVKYPPKDEYQFVLLDAFNDKKIIATSEDGKFENIPCSEAEGGSYRVKLTSLDGKTDFTEPIPVIGFIKQKKVAKKMTVAQIQSLFDKRDPSLLGVGENDYLAPDLKIKFKGLPKDAVNIPTILSEVIEKLDMGTWSAAKVVGLEYDDLNRISNITFKITDSSIDF